MSPPKASRPSHPKEIHVSEVQFLGEHDGAPERLLKGRLTEFFQRDKSVHRAYLAVAILDGQASVTLCLKTQSGVDRGLAEKIGAVFGMIFNAQEHLDIVFLNEQQESQVRRVCSMFFDSNDGCNRR